MEGPSVKGDEVRRERGDWEGVCPSSRSQSSKRLDVGGMETQLPELVVDGWGFTKIWEIVASQRKGIRQVASTRKRGLHVTVKISSHLKT